MGYINHAQEFIDKAVEMYIDGKTARAIGKELGCSPSSVLTWVKKSGFELREAYAKPTTKTVPKQTEKNNDINPLLLAMANGNDLSGFVGKEICKMQPREIYKFLELLNIKGELRIEQRVKLK